MSNRLPAIASFLFAQVSFFLVTLSWGCGSTELKPIEVYPEDMCANCKMAVSDLRFASEIISDQGEVFKLDDIGCMFKYRAKHTELKIAGIFLKDFETKNWISFERSTIVETDVETPMGSGKVAFTDSAKAQAFAKLHPRNKTVSSGSGMGCCAGEKD